MKRALLELSPDALRAALEEMGEKPFRAAQIQKWLTAAVPISGMTNLSAGLRERLAERFTEGYPEVAERLESADGTRKYLLRLADGNHIESVVMTYAYGRTACLSTQVGCGMGCAFCASCKKGLARNLTTGELLGQTLVLNAGAGGGRSLRNLVLMGTGEPLANYGNVVAFLRRINHADSLNISFRNISLSTCGLPERIRRFAGEDIPLTLCLSLHAATDEKRRRIMPVAERYTIEETLDAFRYYCEKQGRRVIIEYILLGGFNDRPEDAEMLKSRLAGMQCHINLIPYNAIEGSAFSSPGKARTYAFLDMLAERGLSATVRRSLGRDIEGACGQLRLRRESRIE